MGMSTGRRCPRPHPVSLMASGSSLPRACFTQGVSASGFCLAVSPNATGTGSSVWQALLWRLLAWVWSQALSDRQDFGARRPRGLLVSVLLVRVGVDQDRHP